MYAMELEAYLTGCILLVCVDERKRKGSVKEHLTEMMKGWFASSSPANCRRGNESVASKSLWSVEFRLGIFPTQEQKGLSCVLA